MKSGWVVVVLATGRALAKRRGSRRYNPGGVGAMALRFSTSAPTLPTAISRSAITVGLSRLGSTRGEAPALSWRARKVAASVSSKRLEILFKQSSTVMRAMGIVSFLADDGRQLALGGFEVLVNYSVIELPCVGKLLACILRAPADDIVRVLPPRAHAPFELVDRGRQDEDADAIGIELAHLLRSLPVDLEDQV